MTTNRSHELALLDQADRFLAQASTLDEIKSFHDKVAGIQFFIREARLGLSLLNQAAEAKLRAERKAGLMLRSMKLRGGNRRSKGVPCPLKLGDLGISRHESKQWQRVASVPDAEFSAYFKIANTLGEEATSAGLLRLATQTSAHPCVRVTTKGGRQQTSQPDSELTSEQRDLVNELANHFGLLTDLLGPICNDQGTEFASWQRHVVGRYLDEIGDMFHRLRVHDANLSTPDVSSGGIRSVR